MAELTGLVIGVGLLCVVGLALDAAGAPRWAGWIPLALGGGVAGFVATLVLALAIWPGACIAVLCPTCYSEPHADAVWRATLVFGIVVGVAVAALPGDRFRLGFALGAAPGVVEFTSHASAAGAGTAVLLAAALAVSLLAVRHELAARLRPSSGPGAGDTGLEDFWDGTRWGPTSGSAPAASTAEAAGRH